ncbi:hypothetical protein BB559_001324 [Furculomyces boomerangus]|uniref:Uncharacterized protein n=2 Tax=Harpellales TaxID=61421 RepID=A0A2T9Z290_9FUNG|nr:hypothetical protein BB559_001324 [Furculomyces boomerangus]PVZ98779.1 hypothetical protein BB558_005209 [Smittium angustum]
MNWVMFGFNLYGMIMQYIMKIHEILMPLTKNLISLLSNNFPVFNNVTDLVGASIFSYMIEIVMFIFIISIATSVLNKISRILSFLINFVFFWGFIIFLAYLLYSSTKTDFVSEKYKAFGNLANNPNYKNARQGLPVQQDEAIEFLYKAFQGLANQANLNVN